MDGDATLSVQIDELSKVAELRWDGAIELIRPEGPERVPVKQCEQLKMHSQMKTILNNIKSEIIHSVNGGRCDSEHTNTVGEREVAELRWDGASELIRGEAPG